MIKFKTRELSDCIRLHFDSSLNDLNADELLNKRMKQGKLNLGFHYILYKDGELVKGIDNKYYADYELDGYKTSIYVLVTADKLTDAQRTTLNELKATLNLPIR